LLGILLNAFVGTFFAFMNSIQHLEQHYHTLLISKSVSEFESYVKHSFTAVAGVTCRMKKIMRSILRRFPRGALERGQKRTLIEGSLSATN
jgi:hypothetical protein